MIAKCKLLHILKRDYVEIIITLAGGFSVLGFNSFCLLALKMVKVETNGRFCLYFKKTFCVSLKLRDNAFRQVTQYSLFLIIADIIRYQMIMCFMRLTVNLF